MPANSRRATDAADIRDDLDDLERQLGGDGGIRERLKGIEVRLDAHEKADEARDKVINDKLDALQASVGNGGWRLSIDPASAKTIAAIILLVLGALGIGGGARELADQVSSPASAQAPAAGE
jgi:hypothetical protein